jgi:hypothetical protein
MPTKQHTPEETPEQVIADAEAAIAEADRLAADLEQRVRDGDETVTLEDIKAAKDAGWFARLRKEAREKKAAELAAQREEAERAALIAEALPLLQGVHDKIDPLLEEAVVKIGQALEYAEAARRARMALLSVAGPRNPYYPDEEAVEKDQFGSVYYGGREYGIVSPRAILATVAERFGIRDIKSDFGA